MLKDIGKTDMKSWGKKSWDVKPEMKDIVKWI